jgi:hypothetical protein
MEIFQGSNVSKKKFQLKIHSGEPLVFDFGIFSFRKLYKLKMAKYLKSRKYIR